MGGGCSFPEHFEIINIRAIATPYSGTRHLLFGLLLCNLGRNNIYFLLTCCAPSQSLDTEMFIFAQGTSAPDSASVYMYAWTYSEATIPFIIQTITN